VTLPPAALQELEGLRLLSFSPIVGPLSLSLPLTRLSTDASRRGWGAVLATRAAPHLPWSTVAVTHGVWTKQEQAQSNNNRELRAILLGFLSLCRDLRNTQVLVESDNTTAVSYLRKLGGRFPSLNHLARQLLSISLSRSIRLLPVHTPGELLTLPDRLSRRGIDRSAWRLHPDLFHQACKWVGQVPQIDLFADRTNCQVPRFISRLPDPLAFTNDAFSVSWTPRQHWSLLWANPPFSIIPQVLRKAQQDCARLLLTLPVWTSAAWWPVVAALPRLMIPHNHPRPYLPAIPDANITKPRWASMVVRLNC
jgi:ribonuclease HI